MKREIKFRAWDAINKEMKHPRKKDVFATGPTSGEFVDNWDNVMQFTGLTDKNGKEIYEGDILRVWTRQKEGYDYVGSVIFDHAAFYLDMPVDFPFMPTLSQWVTTSEILGNIYENPDLLK